MEATSKLARLVSLYREQLVDYRSLLALAHEQQVCMEASNYLVLTEILKRRDRITDSIAASSARVRVLCREIREALGLPEVNLTNLRQKLSAEVLIPLADALAEIMRVIEQIQAVDRQNEAELRLVLNQLRGQTTETERGRAAMRAYKQTSAPEGASGTNKKT